MVHAIYPVDVVRLFYTNASTGCCIVSIRSEYSLLILLIIVSSTSLLLCLINNFGCDDEYFGYFCLLLSLVSFEWHSFEVFLPRKFWVLQNRAEKERKSRACHSAKIRQWPTAASPKIFIKRIFSGKIVKSHYSEHTFENCLSLWVILNWEFKPIKSPLQIPSFMTARNLRTADLDTI